jgi:hypothetical protein
MANTNYWKVERGGIYAVIHCPLCDSWFDVPNAPGNVESYHFCPGCAQPMEVRDEDKLFTETMCSPNCKFLISRQEEYDDEPMGYCDGACGRYIDSMDNIMAGKAECLI